jgi:hypothetical protein
VCYKKITLKYMISSFFMTKKSTISKKISFLDEVSAAAAAAAEIRGCFEVCIHPPDEMLGAR